MNKARSTACIFLCLMSFAHNAHAQFDIVDPSGQFRVGLDSQGNIYNPSTTTGFTRLSDAYDPIRPGTARESWGVSYAGNSGYVDPQAWGTTGNIVPNGAPIFGASTASISSFLMVGTPKVRIDQDYSFLAPNVLNIATKLTNVTGAATQVRFSRSVDWDIAPTEFDEITNVPALPGAPIAVATFSGLENPNPLIPFFNQAPPAGGSFGPSDYGAGLLLDFGIVAPGQTVTFNILHAISQAGQTRAGLESQVLALGADAFVITGVSSDPNGSNAAAFAYTIVPEPSTFALGLLGAFATYSLARKWRR